MKSKIIVIIFMFFISFFAKAGKTYIHDQAECQINNDKIFIQIRGKDLYTNFNDGFYGEELRLKLNGKYLNFNINDDGINRYRLLYADNSICSKLMALRVSDRKVAFFILKDNRPLSDQMMVLYYDLITRKSELVPSRLHIRTAFLKDQKAYFQLAEYVVETKIGTIIIKDNKYHYLEKYLGPWMSFDGKNFRFDLTVTYERFEHKDLISWSQFVKLKNLANIRYRVTIPGKTSRKCISFDRVSWLC